MHAPSSACIALQVDRVDAFLQDQFRAWFAPYGGLPLAPEVLVLALLVFFRVKDEEELHQFCTNVLEEEQRWHSVRSPAAGRY